MSISKEQFLNDVFLTLKDYIQQSAESKNVIKVSRPDKLKQLLPSIENEGINNEILLQELKFILDNSVQTIHPLFVNQLFGGFDEAAWAGEVASTLLNPTMATFEIAPVLTVLEKRVVNELLEMMGELHSSKD